MFKKLDLRWLRYLIFLAGLIVFGYAGQIFVQNFNMQKTVEQLRSQQIKLQWDTDWLENYYEPFLKTEYAQFFFSHKNWVPLENEVMVNLLTPNLRTEKTTSFRKSVLDPKINENNTTWNKFFHKLFNVLFSS